jgi:hypothetical protein
MWIKGSSLLPKEGTLIMCRELYGDQVDYYGAVVSIDKEGTPFILVGDDQTIYFNQHNIEWKEIEKD